MAGFTQKLETKNAKIDGKEPGVNLIVTEKLKSRNYRMANRTIKIF
jgi:hypothetical protein